MAFISGVSAFGAGTVYSLANGDNLFVLGNANVISSGSRAIHSTDGGCFVTVAGFVAANDDGIALGNNSTLDSGIRVVVALGAMVSGGDDGIEIFGPGSFVNNMGTISGAYGITTNGDGGSHATWLNSGMISASQDGLHVGGSETRVFTNTGQVFSRLNAYYSYGIG
ncbi:MAG: hypothetical protein WCC57_15175, partial [Paracoccaceae bacterium]